ncbi:hypothetical protein OEJ37_10410 [Burkholderia sp. BKH01]|nr:hypothetical protein [Burkholderia diffusa]MCU9953771.1 hypothetical protein [Burkholderia sp. BKH01]
MLATGALQAFKQVDVGAQSADELTRLNRLNNQMTLYRALGGGTS